MDRKTFQLSVHSRLRSMLALMLVSFVLGAFLTACGADEKELASEPTAEVSDPKETSAQSESKDSESSTQDSNSKALVDFLQSLRKPNQVAGLGDTLTFDGEAALFDPYAVDVTFKRFMSGQKANHFVQQADPQNPPPLRNYDYVVVDVDLKVNKIYSGSSVQITSANFDLVDAQQSRYPSSFLLKGVETEIAALRLGDRAEMRLVFQKLKTDRELRLTFLSRNPGSLMFVAEDKEESSSDADQLGGLDEIIRDALSQEENESALETAPTSDDENTSTSTNDSNANESSQADLDH